MSKCDVRIELTDNKKTYVQGDTVNGKVYLSVDKDVKCNDLKLSLRWYTHGMGNRDQGEVACESLFKGDLKPGEYSYDFSLKLDKSNPTYHGHYVNIDWIVHAQVDIPWALDPKAQHDISVKRINETKKTSDIIVDMSPKTCGGSIFAMVFMVIFGSVFAIGGSSADGGGIIFSIIGLGIIILGLYTGLYKMVRNKMASKKLGNIEANLSKGVFHPGDSAKLNLKFQPQESIQLNGIKATLKGSEIAVSGSGSDRTTHTHDFLVKDFNIESSRTLSARSPVNHSIDIIIPDDAPQTFSSFNNKIKWLVSLEIDIDKWPDWATEKDIRVI